MGGHAPSRKSLYSKDHLLILVLLALAASVCVGLILTTVVLFFRFLDHAHAQTLSKESLAPASLRPPVPTVPESPDDLRRFIDESFAPYLRQVAQLSGRPFPDVVRDTLRLSSLNLAGISEVAEQERKHPNLREVWVFARRPVDLDPKFYSTVLYNIHERFVHHYYFLPNGAFFNELRDRLVRDLGDAKHVDAHLHWIEVPEVLFLIPPFGLWIGEAPEDVAGQIVFSLKADGTIDTIQQLTHDQAHVIYSGLRKVMETLYGHDTSGDATPHRRDADNSKVVFLKAFKRMQ